MKKYLFIALFFILATAAVYAQTAGINVTALDAEAKALAGDINKKLIDERAGVVVIGQFVYNDSLPRFSAYWANQLSVELINLPNRSFTLLSAGSRGADWTVSGEIVEVAGIIRIYTRLTRSENWAIEAIFHSDIARNEYIVDMLSSSGRRDSSSSPVPMDAWEPDSFENPVPYEIGVDETVMIMNRTIHNRDDEDFFLLLPDRDGSLVIETIGSLDTYMEFYDAETGELLDEDDDSGSNTNARIRYNAHAGKRYIAKVTGYGSNTGHYGFRAYMQTR